MSVTVREATPADAAALVAHLQELAREPGINIPLALDEIPNVDQEKATLEHFANADNAIMLVALDDTASLVGELSLRAISTRKAVKHVATLGMSVKQAARGKGIGRELMTAALEWAPSAGIKRIELYVYARNAPAIALYEKFGFVVEGRRQSFIREGEGFLDDLVMAKLL